MLSNKYATELSLVKHHIYSPDYKVIIENETVLCDSMFFIVHRYG